jgi:hypothetical protein
VEWKFDPAQWQEGAIQALPVRLRDAADAQRSSHRFGETAFACGLACQP